jgi:hypothetical protein
MRPMTPGGSVVPAIEQNLGGQPARCAASAPAAPAPLPRASDSPADSIAGDSGTRFAVEYYAIRDS